LNQRKLREALEKAIMVMSRVPRLLNITLAKKETLIIVGDTHGAIDITQMVLDQFIYHADDPVNNKILFLGDYVDRDDRDLDNMNFVIDVAIKHPDTVFLLRGNHEEYNANASYGFLDTLFRHGLSDLYDLYEHLFSVLPLACYVHGLGVFCCHGMTPVATDVVQLQDITRLEPSTRLEAWDPVTMQLLWNDPNPEEHENSVPGSRGVGFEIGATDLQSFMRANNIKLVIRSHQAFPEGYRFFFQRKVLSIFSKPNYAMHSNNATIAQLHGDGRIDVLEAGVGDTRFRIVDTMKLA
jgi:diadenosine tetraphosphatase ApaH/serine/threonine PP2A family protein phosphatase